MAQRSNLDRLTRFIRVNTALVCGAILLLMVAITVCDVLGRYVFNAPLSGATEVTELLLVSVIFISLPAVCLDHDHVVVDLFTNLMPAKWHPLRTALASLLSAAVLGVIAWRLLVYGQQFASYGGQTSTLQIPIAPVAYICATMTLISALTMAAVSLTAFAPGAHDE